MKENKKVKCLPLFERARLSAEFFVFSIVKCTGRKREEPAQRKQAS
jgi:hypothetical protein